MNILSCRVVVFDKSGKVLNIIDRANKGLQLIRIIAYIYFLAWRWASSLHCVLRPILDLQRRNFQIPGQSVSDWSYSRMEV